MNYSESEKQKIEKILQEIDVTANFSLPENSGEIEENLFELKSTLKGKIFKVQGCYPLLFCNSKRHTLLLNEKDARNFFNFEKINLDTIQLKKLELNYECSSLKIVTEMFNITLFPNEHWGWGLQFGDEKYLLEAHEYGGIEIGS